MKALKTAVQASPQLLTLPEVEDGVSKALQVGSSQAPPVRRWVAILPACFLRCHSRHVAKAAMVEAWSTTHRALAPLPHTAFMQDTFACDCQGYKTKS